MGPFWVSFFGVGLVFSVFFRVFVLGCVICFFLLCFSCAFFGPGCLAPCCSFCRRAFLWPFWLVFSLLFAGFFGAFLALGAGRRAALFAVGLFCGRFWLVFSLLLRAFFGAFLALGAGRRAALFAVGLFCGRFGLCFLFFCGLFFLRKRFFFF